MKITKGNKSSLILPREEAAEYEQYINHVSSTEPQPYYAVNFENDRPVGGRTMTQSQVDVLLAAAKKNGWAIES